MATREAFTKERKPGSAGDKQWTDEEKAAYEKQQARAFRNFARYFAGSPDPKTRLPFKAKVIEIGDAPRPVTNNFGTRNATLVKVELVDPPVAGIRFQMDVTDNDATEKAGATIQNTKAALNHLYVAATGARPPEYGSFVWDTQDILHESEGGNGRFINALIARGQDRDDGRRGGLYSELKDFAPFIEAPAFDDEDEVDDVPLPVVKKPRAKKAAAPAAEDDDDDIPF